ncbi:MAG TPA: MSMEG_6728 family protein [Acidimicrobiales bacterium]|nr:MSMEG_6728 family protein [Acidimicrobiales bacterium]
MQTFLPYPDFARTAALLDSRRLGRQRVEALQVLRALTVPGYGWQSHPVVLMWRGHEEALGRYGLTIVEAWCAKGFGDTCAQSIRRELVGAGVAPVRSQADLARAGALPPWLGDETVHRSHRSALVRKDPDWYRPLFPDVPDDLPYVWPVRSAKALEAERAREARTAGRAARATSPTGRAPGGSRASRR